ncbi:MAG: histidine phosphatase family protein [Solirubrobacteraceae bacterium]|nr:histidine phosphatase family protein [Solirubrobacteraceae bacterium]
MQRLTLIRHATTAAVRAAAFPVDEPLDDAGRAAASALQGQAGRGEALCGPSRRARETARLLGLDAEPVRALDECDFGAWRGRTLEELHEEQPESVGAWLEAPGSSPHGGESLIAFGARVGAWLDERASIDGWTVAVTSGGVIRAAVVHALGAGPEATWRIDTTPLHATVLHAHDGRWTVRSVNAPLAPSPKPGRSSGAERASRATRSAPDSRSAPADGGVVA